MVAFSLSIEVLEKVNASQGGLAPLLPQHNARRSNPQHEPVPMKFSHMPRGVDTIHRAFLKDSLMVYFTVVDTFPFQERRAKAKYYLMLDGAIRQNRVLTIDNGAACMRYQIPGGPRDPWIHLFLDSALHKLTDTPNQRVREQGTGDGNGRFRGESFGSKLVTAVTDMGDADGRDVWLITTDAYPFYEGLGFSTIRSALVGDKNPVWKGAPVVIRLMHRPARSSRAGKPKEDV
ncbi:hypothetical protein C8Q77DRAFT_423097 [Trametes polyzona]|nr:hypothetical protein C8Q77DRAFT_423097 [Trametes polyzona]